MRQRENREKEDREIVGQQAGDSGGADEEMRTVVVKLDRDLVIWLDVFAAKRDKYRAILASAASKNCGDTYC